MGAIWSLPSETARLIAAQRKPKARVCPRCSNVFITVGRGLYCRTACKRAMERRRRAEREDHR
jgi:hypothetical protein